MLRSPVTRAADPLWLPVVPPIIWSTHFTVCYIWAAMACGRFSPQLASSLDQTLAGLTLIALIPIGALFVRGLRQLHYQLPDESHDDGSAEHRTRFMSYLTMLLAGLSAVGTIFVGVAAIALGGCQ